MIAACQSGSPAAHGEQLLSPIRVSRERLRTEPAADRTGGDECRTESWLAWRWMTFSAVIVRRSPESRETGRRQESRDVGGLHDPSDRPDRALSGAYVSGVPDGAADDGLFGPGSVTWRMSADLAAPVAGLRSLLMQALHPLAMAGVDQHSGWRRDPVGRLAATSAYLATITFGDRAAAVHAAARVRRIMIMSAASTR